jgi:DeoR/GlpR family transcriptional regulator of sugar metabolism
MYEIKMSMHYNIDENQYNDVKYDHKQMSILKCILIHNKCHKDNQIDITLFQNENISGYKMESLFYILKGYNQDRKIEAYKILNKYNKKEIINNEIER